MPSLATFLPISITVAPVAPTQPGFGVPLILAKAAAWGASTDKIRYYSSLAALVSDGFAVTDPEYLAATALFSQNPAPSKVGIGKRTLTPTMKIVFTIVQAVVGKVYSVVVNGVVKSFTAVDTVPANVAIGLAAAIGTPAGFGAAVASTNTVTCTASAAGNWGRFAINTALTTPNTDMDCQQTHVDAGIATDLAAIQVIDNTWYAALSVWNSNAEVAALAAAIEAAGKLYLADTQDSTILGAGAGDIASTLKTASYARTAVLYHPDNGAFAAAAWGGARLTKDAGTETWMFATLAGVAVYALTDTQYNNITNKNANYYISIQGVPMTGSGEVAVGQFIDIVRGRDWLQSTMQIAVFATLTSPPSAVNPSSPSGGVVLSKVPFNDLGIAVVEGAIRGALQAGVDRGFLVAPFSVTVPKASAVSLANKTARTLAPISFAAVAAGAIHGASIAGVISF